MSQVIAEFVTVATHAVRRLLSTHDHYNAFVSHHYAQLSGMAEPPSSDLGEPPSVAALSIAATATTAPVQATEQQIDPWSVQAATDEQGNVLAFDYEAISKCAMCLPVS